MKGYKQDLKCCVCWEATSDNENAVVSVGNIVLDEKVQCDGKKKSDFVRIIETNIKGEIHTIFSEIRIMLCHIAYVLLFSL